MPAIDVILPIGGKGSRFSVDGYLQPKPLIPVLGRPMLFRVIDHLKLLPDDQLHIVYHQSMDRWRLRDQIHRAFPELCVRFVPLLTYTRGAAETVLAGLEGMGDRTRPVLVADCDNLFVDDVVGSVRDNPASAIFWFEDKGNEPIYSYHTVGADGLVNQVCEKYSISKRASVGAYAFESGELLQRYCRDILNRGFTDHGEFYMSTVYQRMLDRGEAVESRQVEEWHCLGTPLQLREWAQYHLATGTPRRFCFDLDNTLFTYPTLPGDYSTVQPIQDAINFVNFLYDHGHRIIIHTARRMRTHKGDVEKVKADIGQLTEITLRHYGVKYHELIYGKPWADFYVDDLGVLANHDLEKQTGFYQATHVAPREWHKIEILDDRVVKHGPPESLAGEIHWYQNLPTEFQRFAPRLLSYTDSSIQLERLQGEPLAAIELRGELDLRHIDKLLGALHTLHSLDHGQPGNIYVNYCDKLILRWEAMDWSDFDGVDEVYRTLRDWSMTYEHEQSGIPCWIHGDPVLTNVLYTPQEQIKFIDPRGRLGDQYTGLGDMFYDLGKVYQSLAGYDAVVLDKPVVDNQAWRQYVERYVQQRYGQRSMEHMQMAAASLMFTLIPLHLPRRRQAFFQLTKDILSWAGAR